MKYFLTIILVLVCIILYLYVMLREHNPFDRTIFRHYKISHYPESFMRYTPYASIRYDKRATKYDLLNSVFHCVYIHPQTKVLQFCNLPNCNFPIFCISRFTFDIIDFSEIPLSDLENARLPLIGSLPCSTIVYPSDSSVVDFKYDPQQLNCLYLPGPYKEPTHINGSDIVVDHPFTIYVPSDLLSQYKTSSSWASIPFVDKDKNPVPIDFHAYRNPY